MGQQLGGIYFRKTKLHSADAISQRRTQGNHGDGPFFEDFEEFYPQADVERSSVHDHVR